jgi:hypothetical protein
MTEHELIREMVADPESPLQGRHVHYVVCPQCSGEGRSSLYLGAYTGSEWAEMDPEWQDDYMAGRLDRECETCRGERVVYELLDDAPPEAVAELREWAETEAMYRAEREAGA